MILMEIGQARGDMSLRQRECSQWRKPGAEFGGTENFFADQDDVFF